MGRLNDIFQTFALLPQKHFLRGIDYRYFNDRDVEVPAFLSFLRRIRRRTKSLLDVGAHYSYYYYAQSARDSLLPGAIYDGVDIKSDEKTASILNRYFVGDVTTHPLEEYDAVSCISTIEHCGVISNQKPDYASEQLKVFEILNRLAKKFIFLSFPFGAEDCFENQYANITPPLLEKFVELAAGKARKRFYYNEFPQNRCLWEPVTEKKAGKIPLRKDRGVQCLCVLEIERTKKRSGCV
jgi:hypothetical protein